MAPEAFAADYADGGCTLGEFKPNERQPVPPLKWNDDLGRAARYHTNDMVENNFFSHSSYDGTPFEQRITRFYSGLASGENIARGYQTSRNAVLRGWMCSAGHRANIMRDMFDEIGTSRIRGTYTQNFGADGAGPRPVSIALSDPERPVDAVTFWSDVWVDPGTLDRAVVVLNGEEWPMTLDAGETGRGLYRARVLLGSSAEADSPACSAWYVQVHTTSGAVTRYPEVGLYGWGDCPFDDVVTGFMFVDPHDAEGACEGCSGTGAPVAWPLLLLAAAVRRRRVSGVRT
jgi:uncharacterized protein (TIGR03382 family)